MTQVVQQLQLPKATYDPMKYPNPSLQWFYRVIEALALEDEAPENPEDMTVPKFKQIHKRAGPYINDWRRLLDEQMVLWQREHGFTNDNKLKRESEDPESGLSRKKVKKEKLDLENLPHQELKNIVADDALKGYTIPELKKFLSAKNQNTSGKKPDLIERIEQWVEDN
jgi:ATP-dependent DNA helicase 2 subunit 1